MEKNKKTYTNQPQLKRRSSVNPKTTIQLDVEKLPRRVLETAVKLDGTLKNIYLTVYSFGEPVTPKEVAQKLGYARAYVHMRLCQLESMGRVKRIDGKRRVKFKAI